MAIDSDLPSVKLSSIPSAASSSSSTSSSLSSDNRRKRLLQVATSNSATFIKFPINTRHPSIFVPVCRPRTSRSSTRLPSPTADALSVSNQSKSSDKTPPSSSSNSEDKRGHSQQRINPILINPLLNHRKEQPTFFPRKPSNEYSRTTRLCFSSKPLKSTPQETHTSNVRASTAPVLAHPIESKPTQSNRLNNSTEPQLQYVDENKYDYITRWLIEVRTATGSNESVSSKSKRSKR